MKGVSLGLHIIEHYDIGLGGGIVFLIRVRTPLPGEPWSLWAWRRYHPNPWRKRLFGMCRKWKSHCRSPRIYHWPAGLKVTVGESVTGSADEPRLEPGGVITAHTLSMVPVVVTSSTQMVAEISPRARSVREILSQFTGSSPARMIPNTYGVVSGQLPVQLLIANTIAIVVNLESGSEQA